MNLLEELAQKQEDVSLDSSVPLYLAAPRR